MEKEFYDAADTIEGVNIHYVWTPLGGVPDWETQRVTRFMPLVRSLSQLDNKPGSILPSPGAPGLSTVRLRKKGLKLPQQIPDPQSGQFTNRYLLHYYFEVFQDGYRRYSPLYTEEVVTDAALQSPAHKATEVLSPSQLVPAVQASTKEL